MDYIISIVRQKSKNLFFKLIMVQKGFIKHLVLWVLIRVRLYYCVCIKFALLGKIAWELNFERLREVCAKPCERILSFGQSGCSVAQCKQTKK